MVTLKLEHGRIVIKTPKNIHPVVILTSKGDTTADAVMSLLLYKGINVSVFDSGEILSLSSYCWGGPENKFSMASQDLDILSRATCIWYRRPSTPKAHDAFDKDTLEFVNSEITKAETMFGAEVPFNRWWNHPSVINVANSKPIQLVLAQQSGLNVPKTIVTNSEEVARTFLESLGGTGALKPLFTTNALIDGERRVVFTSKVFVDEISDGVFKTVPHCIQEYIEKTCEYRITLVGEKTFVARIDSQNVPVASEDWRRDAYNRASMTADDIPEKIKNSLHEVKRKLNLNWGAVDMIKTPEGKYVFLEINANGQWYWVEKRTGLKISQAFADEFEKIVNQ